MTRQTLSLEKYWKLVSATLKLLSAIIFSFSNWFSCLQSCHMYRPGNGQGKIDILKKSYGKIEIIK